MLDIGWSDDGGTSEIHYNSGGGIHYKRNAREKSLTVRRRCPMPPKNPPFPNRWFDFDGVVGGFRPAFIKKVFIMMCVGRRVQIGVLSSQLLLVFCVLKLRDGDGPPTAGKQGAQCPYSPTTTTTTAPKPRGGTRASGSVKNVWLLCLRAH